MDRRPDGVAYPQLQSLEVVRPVVSSHGQTGLSTVKMWGPIAGRFADSGRQLARLSYQSLCLAPLVLVTLMRCLEGALRGARRHYIQRAHR